MTFKMNDIKTRTQKMALKLNTFKMNVFKIKYISNK